MPSNLPDIMPMLEAYVDAESLTYVLAALSVICDEKAAHIRTNWQDETTAKAWDGAVSAITRAESYARRVGI